MRLLDLESRSTLFTSTKRKKSKREKEGLTKAKDRVESSFALQRQK
jgi:hypothetical protein